MEKRPELNKNTDAETFREFYYLKSELVDFCRKNGLHISGGKPELTERVYRFLKTGERTTSVLHRKNKKPIENLTTESIIEENFSYSEQRRAFYKEHIGSGFKFCVPFQRWLKNNAGKTYSDSIKAYNQIINNKNALPKVIDKQFEYNTYIRDFFKENKDKTLKQAICCWNYKKSLKGTNKYEASDLIALLNPQ